MKKLFNFVVVFLSISAVNLFSMYGSREGVVSREHGMDIAGEEETQQIQRELARLEHYDREELERQEIAHRQEGIERAQRQDRISSLRHRLDRRGRD